MNARLLLAGAALAALVFPASLSAQTVSNTVDLEGTVRDQTLASLPGAAVEVTHEETGHRRSVRTDGEGHYAVRVLPLGSYHVVVTLANFEPQEASDVPLTLGGPVRLDFTLKVAGQHYDVAVRAEPRLVDSQRPGLGGVVSRAELDALPVDIRNFLSFSLLVPGSGPDRTPQQGASRTSGLVFSGQRARSNSIVVDGLDNNDQSVGSVRAVFSQEAVQEFQVLSNGFSAELGHASGGVVNIVTRSGSNVPSGTAFGYYRNAALSSRNYFDRFTPAGTPTRLPEAPYEHAQFGATFGAPLKRDRSFLFGSIERLTRDTTNLVTIDDATPVPNPLAPGTTLGTAAGILRRAGFPVDTGHVPFDVRSTQWLLRFDHAATATGEHRLTVRTSGAAERNENIEPFGGLVARSRGAVLANTDVMGAATFTSLFRGARLVNDARVLAARRDQDVQSLDPTCDGECDRVDEGGPTAEVIGVASVGRHRFTPTPRDDTHYQFADTISLVGERHTIKAGLDASFIDGRDRALPLHFGGRYIFAALPAIPGVLPVPLSSIQALGLGLPAAYVQGYGEPAFNYNTASVAAFAEDTWTSPTLSLRLGLRYQRQLWPTAAYTVPGIAQPYGVPTDSNDFAPRAAIAWSPSTRTVVRGGYGIYYDDIITATVGVAHNVSGQPDGIRTLVLSAPAAFAAWGAPGHRLPEPAAAQLAGGSFPSVVIALDPALKTPYARHAFAGVERQLTARVTAGITGAFARGFNQLGTIDYNPIVPALGPRRRPGDVNGVAGTSASVLQYTSFGETWYSGVTASVETRGSRGTLRAFYTLSKAEDTSADFQSAFLPQDNGTGRDPSRPAGLPRNFSPDLERGPALHDQRHRFVAAGQARLPWKIAVGGVITAASGWPYNVLAGSDLNGDGDGGAFPSDRARRNPADAATSVGRDSGRLPTQATVDLRIGRPIRFGRRSIDPVLDVFNLFNRTNFVDVQNIFGTGAYPAQPSSTFGQFTQAAAGRQVQVGLRVSF